MTDLTPKTTAAFDVYAGDVLVAYAYSWTWDTVVSISNNGAALTWALREDVTFTSYNVVRIWTTVVPQNRAGLTVTFTRTGPVNQFMGDVLTFRGSDGVGASAQNHQNTGAPSVNITTTGAESAIVVASTDDNGGDGSGRVWRAGAGSAVELLYYRDFITQYSAYHPNAGDVGTYAVGLSAPNGQWYSIAAVEVLAGTLTDVYAGGLVFTRKR